VLLLPPWHYAFSLILNPLISALAAGNTAVLKPSEVAPACASLIESLLSRYVDTEAVRVVQGAVAETTALLEQRFDSIFFTGGCAVARVVMAAAAKHLTPVTLELGGKNPAIVDETCSDLAGAARAILTGRCANAGQICMAPDYVLVHAKVGARESAWVLGQAALFFSLTPVSPSPPSSLSPPISTWRPFAQPLLQRAPPCMAQSPSPPPTLAAW